MGGKPVQKALRVPSKDAARILLAEYQTLEARERHRSTLLTLKRSISDAVREYMDTANHGRAPETVREKKGALKRFEEFLGGRYAWLADITHAAIEEYYAKRVKESLAGANKDLKVIKTFLNHAIKKGYLHDNAAEGIKKARTVKKIFRNLSFKEMERLLETARVDFPHLYGIVAAAYYLGLRKHELAFLEWDDVDFDRNIVYVRSKAENRIKDCEERIVPINRKLKEVLTGLPRKGRFVFPTKSGGPWRNNLYREFQKVVRKAELRDVSVQTIRETFGSHLLQKGVSIYLVSKYLGHSSVDVTTRHYAHVAIEETHKEIDLL